MNPHKGDVSLQVGDKTYTLRYSHLALVRLENVLNKSLMQIMGDLGKPEVMRLGTIVALLWAGLQKHHPGMTEEQAAEILDEIDGGVATAMVSIDAAFSKAFGAASGTKGTNPPLQASGNGSGTISLSSTFPTDSIPTTFGTSRPER